MTVGIDPLIAIVELHKTDRREMLLQDRQLPDTIGFGDAPEEIVVPTAPDSLARQGIEPRIFVCRPSRGSQVLTTVETARV